MQNGYTSWGRYPHGQQDGQAFTNRFQDWPSHRQSLLPYGNGRSYGDSCLNRSGLVLDCQSLNRFIDFDPQTGVITCEAGVQLKDILALVVPQGWFLPVTPGTQFVTVGGAIGNDVHGKNHHFTGTFGCHVLQFELLRSDNSRLLCSREQNFEWFGATIGGLGLTGIVTWAQLQLKRVSNAAITGESIKYQNLRDFFTLSADSDHDYEYTAAWIDCLAKGKQLGRGHFIRGNHAPAPAGMPKGPEGKLDMFVTPPLSLVNPLSLQAFNWLYYHRQQAKNVRFTSHYDPFLYPLDSITNWNRMYGPKGFQQFQCVIPMADSYEVMKDILELIGRSQLGSFLVVLKICGDVESPGWLSFPLPGVSLAIDFPNQGRRTNRLYQQLDQIVHNAKGRLYPAKDAHMPAELFQAAYPKWQQLESLRDPAIQSDFWRRVTTG